MKNFFWRQCASLLAILFMASSIWACLNEYEHEGSKKPNPAYATQFGTLRPYEYLAELTKEGKPAESENKLAEFQEKAANGQFQDRSNYAIALIRHRRVSESLPILEQVAAEQPNEYVAAANLGTAYELSGDNVKALEWIRKGIALNPQAHDGTEWLHARILEAKVRLSDDPDWLKNNSILDIDFGNGAKPRVPQKQVLYEDQAKSLPDVRKALEYQLRERISLVEAPDAVVGDLLATLGNLLTIEGSEALAVPVYGLALNYGAAQAVLVQTRQAALKAKVAGSHFYYQPILWVAAVFCAAIAFYVGQRVFRRASATI